MFMLVRFFRGLAHKPLEAIEAIVALILFSSGLWLISPLWQARAAIENTATAEAAGNIHLPMILGIIQVIMAIVLFGALVASRWPLRQKVRQQTTFWYFVLLLFYGFSGLAINGLEKITWVTTFGLALIMGVCHLKLKFDGSDARN